MFRGHFSYAIKWHEVCFVSYYKGQARVNLITNSCTCVLIPIIFWSISQFSPDMYYGHATRSRHYQVGGEGETLHYAYTGKFGPLTCKIAERNLTLIMSARQE
jgi:hypothetical protein